MIRLALSLWQTTTVVCRDRFAQELSKWSRGTLIAVLGFGSFMMLLGGLFSWGLARIGYQQLERGGFPVTSGADYWSVVRFWAIVLTLLFGGDFIRAAAWRDLRRRRVSVAANANDVSMPRVSVIVGALFALGLLFWGALGVASFIRSWQIVMGGPVYYGPIWAKIRSRIDIGSVTVWWLLTIACLAGGAGLLWRGIRSLTSTGRTESVPPSTGAAR